MMLWEGPRTGTERACVNFGVDKALPMTSLENFVREHLNAKNAIFHDLDSNSALPVDLRSKLAVDGTSITSKLQHMRVTKQAEEVHLVKDACQKSAQAFKETMSWSMKHRNGCENSIAAKMEFNCRLRGATGLAYVPVVAAAERSLILHYTRNNMIGNAGQGDLMFMDAGGKFDGYCTDISRSWPLAGKFSESQKRIYEAVLRVQQACIKVCGMHAQEEVNLDMLNALSGYLFIEELKALGFKNPEKIIDRVYPHSIGHYLGLDLHDCPTVLGGTKLQPGLIITIEPGLYIPYDPLFPPEYHGIGVRIEDDIVIDQQGCTVMTEGVPKEVEHIEGLLRS